jgi:outer membrane protein OmpA-like peptidoglycan-associated protein
MMAQVGSGALVLSSISGLSLTGIVADAVTRERLIYALPGSMPQDIPGRALLQLPEEAAFLAQQEAERRAASALGKTHPCQADIDRVMAGNPLVFVEEEARLEESATQTLEQLGKILTNCGPLNLEITAYATSVQGTMIAQTLSAQRGQLVADALSAMGIDKNLIRVTGAGPPPPERLDTNLISLKATLVSP